MSQAQGSSKKSGDLLDSSQLHEWTERCLLSYLESFLEHKPSSLSICFFIDGLDEFAGDQTVLLKTVRKLSKTA